MKFYENSELVATLNKDEALDHCLKCSYCSPNADGLHYCMLCVEEFNIEGVLEIEDGNQLECWKP